MKNKQVKYEVVGYYYDGRQAYTLFENEDGKTKKIKGII